VHQETTRTSLSSMSVSSSTMSFEQVEEVDRTPINQFLNVLDDLQLGTIGPELRGHNNGENKLIETAKVGQFNFDVIAKAIDALEKQGQDADAGKIARRAKANLQDSAENILYLRTQAEDIASFLQELGEHVSNNDRELVDECLTDVKEAATRISKKSLMVKAGYSNAEEELLEKHRDFKQKEKHHEDRQTMHTAASVVSGTGAVVTAVATPVVATTYVSVFGATLVAVCPVTLVAGLTGAALFATFSYINATAAKCNRLQATSHQEMANMSHQIVQAADMNQGLWVGVGMAADELKENGDALRNLNPRRQKEVKRRTEAMAQSLRIFVETLDEYLVWLSLCKYFPANYPLEQKLGADRFKKMRVALMDK